MHAQILTNNQNIRKVVDNIAHAKKIPFTHLEYNMEEADSLKF